MKKDLLKKIAAGVALTATMGLTGCADGCNELTVKKYEFLNGDKSYVVGEEFNLSNLLLKITMSDGSTLEIPVTMEMIQNLDELDMNTPGEKSVKISYNDTTYIFKINVTSPSTAPVVTSSKFEGQRTIFNVGDTFEIVEGTKLVLTMSNSQTPIEVDVTTGMLKPNQDLTLDETGVKTVTILYEGKEYTYNIYVGVTRVIIKIGSEEVDVEEFTRTYKVGDTVSLSGKIIEQVVDSENDSVLNSNEYDFTNDNIITNLTNITDTKGQKDIVINYANGKNVIIKINVVNNEQMDMIESLTKFYNEYLKSNSTADLNVRLSGTINGTSMGENASYTIDEILLNLSKENLPDDITQDMYKALVDGIIKSNMSGLKVEDILNSEEFKSKLDMEKIVTNILANIKTINYFKHLMNELLPGTTEESVQMVADYIYDTFLYNSNDGGMIDPAYEAALIFSAKYVTPLKQGAMIDLEAALKDFRALINDHYRGTQKDKNVIVDSIDSALAKDEHIISNIVYSCIDNATVHDGYYNEIPAKQTMAIISNLKALASAIEKIEDCIVKQSFTVDDITAIHADLGKAQEAEKEARKNNWEISTVLFVNNTIQYLEPIFRDAKTYLTSSTADFLKNSYFVDMIMGSIFQGAQDISVNFKNILVDLISNPESALEHKFSKYLAEQLKDGLVVYTEGYSDYWLSNNQEVKALRDEINSALYNSVYRVENCIANGGFTLEDIRYIVEELHKMEQAQTALAIDFTRENMSTHEMEHVCLQYPFIKRLFGQGGNLSEGQIFERDLFVSIASTLTIYHDMSLLRIGDVEAIARYSLILDAMIATEEGVNLKNYVLDLLTDPEAAGNNLSTYVREVMEKEEVEFIHAVSMPGEVEEFKQTIVDNFVAFVEQLETCARNGNITSSDALLINEYLHNINSAYYNIDKSDAEYKFLTKYIPIFDKDHQVINMLGSYFSMYHEVLAYQEGGIGGFIENSLAVTSLIERINIPAETRDTLRGYLADIVRDPESVDYHRLIVEVASIFEMEDMVDYYLTQYEDMGYTTIISDILEAKLPNVDPEDKSYNASNAMKDLILSPVRYIEKLANLENKFDINELRTLVNEKANIMLEEYDKLDEVDEIMYQSVQLIERLTSAEAGAVADFIKTSSYVNNLLSQFLPQAGDNVANVVKDYLSNLIDTKTLDAKQFVADILGTMLTDLENGHWSLSDEDQELGASVIDNLINHYDELSEEERATLWGDVAYLFRLQNYFEMDEEEIKEYYKEQYLTKGYTSIVSDTTKSILEANIFLPKAEYQEWVEEDGLFVRQNIDQSSVKQAIVNTFYNALKYLEDNQANYNVLDMLRVFNADLAALNDAMQEVNNAYSEAINRNMPYYDELGWEYETALYTEPMMAVAMLQQVLMFKEDTYSLNILLNNVADMFTPMLDGYLEEEDAAILKDYIYDLINDAENIDVRQMVVDLTGIFGYGDMVDHYLTQYEETGYITIISDWYEAEEDKLKDMMSEPIQVVIDYLDARKDLNTTMISYLEKAIVDGFDYNEFIKLYNSKVDAYIDAAKAIEADYKENFVGVYALDQVELIRNIFKLQEEKFTANVLLNNLADILTPLLDKAVPNADSAAVLKDYVYAIINNPNEITVNKVASDILQMIVREDQNLDVDQIELVNETIELLSDYDNLQDKAQVWGNIATFLGLDAEKTMSEFNQKGYCHIVSDLVAKSLEPYEFYGNAKYFEYQENDFVEVSSDQVDELIKEMLVNMVKKLETAQTAIKATDLVDVMHNYFGLIEQEMIRVNELIGSDHYFSEKEAFDVLYHLTDMDRDFEGKLLDYAADYKSDIAQYLTEMVVANIYIPEDKYDELYEFIENNLDKYFKEEFDINAFYIDIATFINQTADKDTRTLFNALAVYYIITQGDENTDYNEIFSFIELPDGIASVDYNVLVAQLKAADTYKDLIQITNVNTQHIIEGDNLIKEVITLDVKVDFDIQLFKLDGDFTIEVELYV